MPYLGNDLQVAFESYRNIDDISGSFDGSTTSFALQVGGVTPAPFPKIEQNVLISVGGVIQKPDSGGTTGFKFTGTNIVFSSAPAVGESFFGVILAGADYVNAGTNFPVGTVDAPSITFKDDEDTGLYHPSSNTVSVTTGGTQRATFDSSGNLGIGTSSPGSYYADELVIDIGSDTQNGLTIVSDSTKQGMFCFADGTSGTERYRGYINYHHNTDKLTFGTAGSARIDITSTGRVGIGVTDPNRTLDIQTASNDNGFTLNCIGTPSNYFLDIRDDNTVVTRLDPSGRLLVGCDADQNTFGSKIQAADSSSAASIALNRYTNDAHPPYVYFYKSRNGTVGSQTVVQDGDTLGNLQFLGSDGSNSAGAAELMVQVDGTPGDNDMPGRFVFKTSPDGSQTPAERLRISATGEINTTDDFQIGTTGSHTKDLRFADATRVDAVVMKVDNSDDSDFDIVNNRGTGDIMLATNSAERLRIDKNGAITIGIRSDIHATNDLAKLGIDCQGINSLASDANDVENYGLAFYNSPTTDEANGIGFFNDDGTTCGGFIVHQDKGSGNLGDLVFGTANASDTPIERMRITQLGKVQSISGVQTGGNNTAGWQFDSVDTACYLAIQGKSAANGGAAGNAILQTWFGSDNTFRVNCDGTIKTSKGIDFSGAQSNQAGMESELLDHYEIGTWTPQLGGTGGNSFTYHADCGGTYCRVGDWVTLFGVIRLTARSGTGNLTVHNFPFTCGDFSSGDSNAEGGVVTTYTDNSASGTHGPIGNISSGDGSAQLYHQISSGNGSALSASEIDATFLWRFIAQYPAA